MEEPNELIKAALSEVAQQVNAGLTPTAALRKVAESFDLNPNYIQRTGEALNVALTHNHFKTAADRSTNFPIADIPAVISSFVGSKEKTAAQTLADHFPQVVDSHGLNFNRMLTSPQYKQAYLEIAGASEKNEYNEPTMRSVYEKAAAYVENLKKQAEEADMDKVAANAALSMVFSELCDSFRKDASYRTSFEEFESQCFSKHGEQAVPFLDLLHKTACASAERGVHDAGYVMFNQCKEARLFDEFLSTADDLAVNTKKAEDASANYTFESSKLKETHALLGKLAAKKEDKEEVKEDKHPLAGIIEGADEEPEDPVLAAIKKKASAGSVEEAAPAVSDPVLAAAMEKEAFFGGLGTMLSGAKMLDSLIGKEDPMHSAFNHTFNKPSGPIGAKPNMTLENMERKLLLQELLLTDPILSRQPAPKVVRAFEQLLRLSPEISKEKEVVRAELRAMCATQALSKFDANQMSKMDMDMLKRRAATQAFNRGDVQNFKF